MTPFVPPTSEQQLSDEGWRTTASSGFTAEVGALWVRQDGEQVAVAMTTAERHCNHLAHTVHGGVLMTFADNALGFAVVHSLGAPRCVTLSLQTQFISPGKVGEVLWCRPEIVRKGRRTVFVRGLICAGDRTVASVEGIWSVLESKG